MVIESEKGKIVTTYEHKADHCSGNFFDAVHMVEKLYTKDGWQIASAQRDGNYTIFIMKRKTVIDREQ